MTPRLRKAALAVHITASVGWVGAVLCYLALAVTGLTSPDAHLVRGVYLAMERVAWAVLVPMNLASLITGLVSSLGSPWGLFRHYWVFFKLVLNLLTTIILLLYMRSIGYFADIAGQPALSRADLAQLRDPSPVAHSGAALLVLLVATALGVYKPRGLTRYGHRRQLEKTGPA